MGFNCRVHCSLCPLLVFVLTGFIVYYHFWGPTSIPDPPPIDKSCNISIELKTEIASYSYIVNKIISSTSFNRFRLRGNNVQGKMWKELAYFTDRFGNRISGSQNLENAIDYMIEHLISYELENVHSENVSVPHWIR